MPSLTQILSQLLHLAPPSGTDPAPAQSVSFPHLLTHQQPPQAPPAAAAPAPAADLTHSDVAVDISDDDRDDPEDPDSDLPALLAGLFPMHTPPASTATPNKHPFSGNTHTPPPNGQLPAPPPQPAVTQQPEPHAQPPRPIHTEPRELRTPVNSPTWSEDLGAELLLMTRQDQHSATLKLNPEHLGPLEVRISLKDGEATVWFGASHPDTRTTLEHCLPRLREMFAAQGMVLADAGVFKEEARNEGSWAVDRETPPDDLSERTEGPKRSSVKASGLIDTYA